MQHTKKLGADEINHQKSRKTGFLGWLETGARRLQTLAFVVALAPIFILYILCLGLSAAPGIGLLLALHAQFAESSIGIQALVYGLGLGVLFVSFIVLLLIVVPIFNLPFKPFVRAYRGPWFSFESLPWLYHNSLMYLVRYTVLDFATPTPLATGFLKAMGMKIGKGSLVNTSNISDPCLIEIGDYVTVGGSCYLMAHYGMKGFLIIEKLVLKRKCNIGLHCYLMGGVEVGELAQILPNTVVLPKTKVPAGAKYDANSPMVTSE